MDLGPFLVLPTRAWNGNTVISSISFEYKARYAFHNESCSLPNDPNQYLHTPRYSRLWYLSSPDPDFGCGALGALGAFAAPIPIPPIVDPEVELVPIPIPIPAFEGLDTAGFAMPIPPDCVLHAFPLDAPGGGGRENDDDDDCCCACELSDRLFIDAPMLLKADGWVCCPMGVPVVQGFEAAVGEVVEVDQLTEDVEG